jgi:hypothetical protein
LLRALGGQAARDLGRGEELDRARGKRGEGGLLVSSFFFILLFQKPFETYLRILLNILSFEFKYTHHSK